MFRKLIKYEWAAMIRSMLPIYIAVVAMTFISTLMLHFGVMTENPLFEQVLLLQATPVITAAVYGALLVAMGALTVIMIISRFYKGLLQEEGYLMFTLPVPVWKLVLSKAVVSFFIGVISLFVGFFSVAVCLSDFTIFMGLGELFKEMFWLLGEAWSEDAAMVIHMSLFFLEILAAMTASVFGGLYHLYLSMAVGHQARKHKIALSVGAYMGIDVVSSFIGILLLQFVNLALLLPIDLNFDAMPLIALHLIGVGLFFLTALETALMAAATNLLLERNLNLE